MIRRVTQTALESKADEVIVVLGWQADRIRAALHGLSCRTIVNTNFEVGQSSSVRTGLAAVNSSADAVLILPGDVAMVNARSINKVIDKYHLEKHMIVIAGHGGKPGHPILFDRLLFPEIEHINEESFGLKAVVKKHAGEICLVETGSSNVLKDIDTLEDLHTISQHG